MADPFPSIADGDNQSAAAARLAAVHGAIAAAATLARRNAADVTLIAVSKTHDAAAIRPLIAAGQRHFGENRVQEADGKWPALRDAAGDITLHMVGQLQSNKAADAVRLFDVIHTLDRPSLIAPLARAMDSTGRRIPCFIQLNLAGEAQKGGCTPADATTLIAEVRAANIPIIGLMTVPPVGLEPAPWFALLGKLADDHGLPGLSMGMSGDYPTAVTLGATHIRVGTALFGTRA
ncbi:MAG: YggS family pyridoxal phosphate-dependent enzyme [Sphingopyxis sp.]|jgi:hypothetical protein|nr:YggS family pyridoxal phosphate-dependent enzyme [Sphingopyxis sp.]